MATIYKTFTINDIETRGTTQADSSKSQEITTILNSFVTMFKNKHLS